MKNNYSCKYAFIWFNKENRIIVNDLSKLSIEEIFEKYDMDDFENNFIYDLVINIDGLHIRYDYRVPEYVHINKPMPVDSINWDEIEPSSMKKLESDYQKNEKETYHPKSFVNRKNKLIFFNILKYSFPTSLFKKDYEKMILPRFWYELYEKKYHTHSLLKKPEYRSARRTKETYNHSLFISEKKNERT